MCGILITSGLPGAFSHRALKSLRKRGPDEIGFWSDDRLHVGHTRLSIIGLDERGTQPMENERHVLAFNGEIYNFASIKRRLDDEGIHVSGVSDTEVLLHAWTRWGASIAVLAVVDLHDHHRVLRGRRPSRAGRSAATRRRR